MKVIKLDNNNSLNEALRIKRHRLSEEDNQGMSKFHMVYTVDGVKSEQDISAANVAKAEELVRKQYDGKNIIFTSKKPVQENLREAYGYTVTYDDLIEIQGKIDRLIRKMADNHQDEISPSSNTYRIGLPFIGTREGYIDLQNMNQYIEGHEDDWDEDEYDESLNEDLAALIQQLHDKDEYLWNLHSTNYDWLYDECSKYSDCWGSADCKDSIADCIRRMPKDAQYKLLDKLVAPLHESLNEDMKDSEKVLEADEKLPQTEETVGLSNAIIQEINGEWETIQHYNDLISIMRTEGQDDMINVISDIVDEENKHIGQLQKCLQIISPNVSEIDSGETEAIGQLNTIDNEVADDSCVDCVDDDFGPNSGFDIYLV